MLRFLIIFFLITLPSLSFSQQFKKGELIGSKGFTYGKEVRILNYNSDAYPDILAFPFIHVNDGDGNREKTIQFSDIENVETLAVADFNNDGLDDVVTLLEDGAIEIFLNSRKGLKPLQQDSKLVYYRIEYSDIYITDINADKHLDILINRFGDYVMAFTGDGKGQFQKFKDFKKLFGSFGFVASKDIDGDGKQEILSNYVVIENEERKVGIQIRTYENGSYIQKGAYMLSSGFDVFYIEDVDNDGDLDFIYSSEYENGIYWNERDTDGNYSKVHKIETEENATNFYLFDMDDDKDLDVVKNTRVGPVAPSKNYWIENIGKGEFSEEKPIAPKHKSAFMLVDDFNADGKGDLVEVSVTNGHRISVGINNNANFEYGKDWVSNGGINDFDFMDINDDGIKDIMVASRNRLFYYEVSKKGKISEAKDIAQNEFFFNKIFLTDIDNDGLTDVFWWDEMSKDDRVGWYKNLGMGQFESQEVNLTETRVANANLIDFDSDGDMDIVAYELGKDRAYGFHVYPNNNGDFTSPRITVTESDKFKELFVFDANLDGKADVVNLGAECKCYSFDNGKFSEFEIPFVKDCARFSYNLVMADIDNDGIEDILVDQKRKLNWSKVTSDNKAQPLQIIEEQVMMKDLVHTGDIDNDGDIDIIFRSSDYVMVDAESFTNKYKLMWLENDGNGVFKVNLIGSSSGNSRVIKLHDIDGDGDLDVFQPHRKWDSSGLFMYENTEKK